MFSNRMLLPLDEGVIAGLAKQLRAGARLVPNTPGLLEAARRVFRPMVEAMRGQNIIFHSRQSFLLRVDELSVDDRGFRATAKVLKHYPDEMVSPFAPELNTPFRFQAAWPFLSLAGKAIQMALVTDRFVTDAKVVLQVGAAEAEGAGWAAISRMIRRAWEGNA